MKEQKMQDSEPSDDWLQRLNTELAHQNLPPNARVRRAVDLWFEGNPCDPFGDIATAAFEKIFGWFADNTKIGAVQSSSIRSSVFYFDHAFWKVSVPLVFGCPQTLNPLEFLKVDAPAVLNLLVANQSSMMSLEGHIVDEINLSITLENVDKLIDVVGVSPHGVLGLLAADLHLQAAVALLSLPKPNLRAIESIRFAVELALKAFLASHDQFPDSMWDEPKHRQKYTGRDGHDLVALYRSIVDRGVAPPFDEKYLSFFPPVSIRYSVRNAELAVAWHVYRLGLSSVSMAAEKIEASL